MTTKTKLTFTVSDRKPKNAREGSLEMRIDLNPDGSGVKFRMELEEDIPWGGSPRIIEQRGLWLLRAARWFRMKRASRGVRYVGGDHRGEIHYE